jgi:hypothetical protein
MERQLFDWAEWDEVDNVSKNFYKVVTKVQIGPYPPQTFFDTAYINFDDGLLAFYQKGEQVAVFKLNLVVGEAVASPTAIES